jgi:hypothetical protein
MVSTEVFGSWGREEEREKGKGKIRISNIQHSITNVHGKIRNSKW